jgi:hypothetical protein
MAKLVHTGSVCLLAVACGGGVEISEPRKQSTVPVDVVPTSVPIPVPTPPAPISKPFDAISLKAKLAVSRKRAIAEYGTDGGEDLRISYLNYKGALVTNSFAVPGPIDQLAMAEHRDASLYAFSSSGSVYVGDTQSKEPPMRLALSSTVTSWNLIDNGWRAALVFVTPVDAATETLHVTPVGPYTFGTGSQTLPLQKSISVKKRSLAEPRDFRPVGAMLGERAYVAYSGVFYALGEDLRQVAQTHAGPWSLGATAVMRLDGTLHFFSSSMRATGSALEGTTYEIQAPANIPQFKSAVSLGPAELGFVQPTEDNSMVSGDCSGAYEYILSRHIDTNGTASLVRRQRDLFGSVATIHTGSPSRYYSMQAACEGNQMLVTWLEQTAPGVIKKVSITAQ